MRVQVDFYEADADSRPVLGGGQLRKEWAGRRPPRLSSLSWAEFRRRVQSIDEHLGHGRETGIALAAGARAIAAGIKEKLGVVLAQPKGKRYRYWETRARRERKAELYLPEHLEDVIKGRIGTRREWVGTAYVQLGGRGARQAWLVDQGHGGPKSTSPRTPGYPYIIQGIEASERARDEAIIRSYQRQFPDIARRIREGLASERAAGAGAKGPR